MSPEDEYLEPEWSTGELAAMKEVLTSGVDMLREKTKLQ